MLTRMFQRRGTAEEWADENPIPGDGEICLIRDFGSPIRFKIGDGITHFADLPEFSGSGGGFSDNAIFGNGEDGDLVLTEGTTFFDRNYNFQNLYVSEDAVLDLGGYIINVAGVLSGSGSIVAKGEDGTESVRGNGYHGYSIFGRTGGSPANAGQGNGCSLGGSGGAGSTSAGGAGGGISLGTPTRGGVLVDAVSIIAEYSYGGSGGGGGGAGDDTGSGSFGAGGGGGGGSIWLAAKTNAFTGVISVEGGKGGDAVSPNAGGGGGGGGGLLVFIAGAGIHLPTLTAAGGLGGTGNGTGANGHNGYEGHVGAYSYGGGSDRPVNVTVNLTTSEGGGGGEDEAVHRGTGTNSTILGDATLASETKAMALGDLANASATQAIAIGFQALNDDPYTTVVKTDSMELVPASGVQTGYIFHDEAGNRWKVTVDTTGHLFTTPLT